MRSGGGDGPPPQHQKTTPRTKVATPPKPRARKGPKRYFDTTRWLPAAEEPTLDLAAEILIGAPRGGTAANCCRFCTRQAKNKRLRSCEACGQHYCGRRACRLCHVFACGGYRPHWKKNTARPGRGTAHGRPQASTHSPRI